jgi:hypothetical protein
MAVEGRQPVVLLVSNDSAVRGGLTTILPLAGWRVQDVPTVTLAMHNIRATLPDVLLTEHRLLDDDAFGLIRAFRTRPGNEKTVVGVLVDAIDRATALNYVRAGVTLFFAKPLDLIDVSEKLAEKVSGMTALPPPRSTNDPLVRGVLAIISPSLNLKDTAEKALGDEFDVVFFDGTRGIDAHSRRAATVIVVDEGVAGGLEAQATWKALFGPAPLIATTTRGNETQPGHVEVLSKPVRDLALRRAVRSACNRVHVALFPTASGVVVRLRDGWDKQDTEVFEQILVRLREISAQAKETGRKWLCLDGAYLGAPDHLEKSSALYEAASRAPLHIGLVTNQTDLGFVARQVGINPIYVHSTSANFIKAVQDLA